MAQIRILVGYRTEHRRSEPVVLAIGEQKSLQAALDASPEEFIRFEVGAFHFIRKSRRSRPNFITPGASESPQAAESDLALDDSSPEEQPSGDEAPATDDDGPSLSSPSQARPRRR